MDYLDEQIETFYESNYKKKAELNQKKQKLIKNMIYNDIGIPKQWVSKQDYKDTLCKIVCCDAKLVHFLGLGSQDSNLKPKISKNRASTAKSLSRGDIKKEAMISSNSAVKLLSNQSRILSQSKISKEDFFSDKFKPKMNFKKEFENVCGDKFWEENESYRKYNRPQSSRVEVYDRMKSARLNKAIGIDPKKIEMTSEKITKPLSVFPSLNSLRKKLACKADEDLRKHFESNKSKGQFDLHKPSPKRNIVYLSEQANKLNVKDENQINKNVNSIGPNYLHFIQSISDSNGFL